MESTGEWVPLSCSIVFIPSKWLSSKPDLLIFIIPHQASDCMEVIFSLGGLQTIDWKKQLPFYSSGMVTKKQQFFSENCWEHDFKVWGLFIHEARFGSKGVDKEAVRPIGNPDPHSTGQNTMSCKLSLPCVTFQTSRKNSLDWKECREQKFQGGKGVEDCYKQQWRKMKEDLYRPERKKMKKKN